MVGRAFGGGRRKHARADAVVWAWQKDSCLVTAHTCRLRASCLRHLEHALEQRLHAVGRSRGEKQNAKIAAAEYVDRVAAAWRAQQIGAERLEGGQAKGEENGFGAQERIEGGKGGAFAATSCSF